MWAFPLSSPHPATPQASRVTGLCCFLSYKMGRRAYDGEWMKRSEAQWLVRTQLAQGRTGCSSSSPPSLTALKGCLPSEL